MFGFSIKLDAEKLAGLKGKEPKKAEEDAEAKGEATEKSEADEASAS